MTCEPAWTVLTTVVVGFLAAGARARSWDLAVVIGREIDFLASNQTSTGQAQIADAVALTGVAYDDITRTMYLSDNRNNVSIFSNDLTEKNITSRPLLKKQNGTHILGMAFDPSTRTLIWSDALREAILKMHVPVDDQPPGVPVVLHSLAHRNPRGIAFDVCNSHVYWVNSNNTDPSIERSGLDGSDRRIIVRENLYEPLAVAIDHLDRKLYWIDDVEGIHFKIERSNLDGTGRELLLKSKHQLPVYLAVDRTSVYWTEWVHSAVWTMPKNPRPGDVPRIFRNYYETNRDSNPAGIIARDNVGHVDCEAIDRLLEKRTNSLATAPGQNLQRLVSYNNLTTSTEESDMTTEKYGGAYCLNDGALDKDDGGCRCKTGFSGEHCETSLCHNYCLHGSCTVDVQGRPGCSCNQGYTGDRCQRNVCDGFCLNDGVCIVHEGRPSCRCKYSKGSRCESLDDVAEICAILCARSPPGSAGFDDNPCRCAETNRTEARISQEPETVVDYGAVLPALAALAGALLLLVMVLSYYVNKLRRRPRIKKRFVVSKGGVTPLTSRPQIPDNQCEITIENCCNMNICETPCFEPKLRTPAPRSTSTKKEEKNSLLDNMEGNSC